MHDYVFDFLKISFSPNHPFTLIFKGNCTHSFGREVAIRYTGAEIINESAVAVPLDILRQLHAELQSDFGYGPFDIKDARKKLKAKNRYYFDFNREP